MKYSHCLWLTVLSLPLGCGGAAVHQHSPKPATDAAKSEAPAGAEGAGALQTPAPAAQELIPRKLIYTADARLIVQDFEKAEHELVQLIKDHKGYVAQAETGGTSGAPRSGRWKVRVPVERFDDFLDAVTKLGVPQKISRDSKDVTEEFYDLEARLKSKKVEEARLLKHLEESTGKLKEILDVERELTRVRGEIEQQEGRLRLLANLTSLTTVTVFLQEIKDYVPPQTPTFGSAISTTFADSVGALTEFGKGIVLFAVGLAPWLPVLALLGVPVWRIVRAYRRRAALPVAVRG